MKSAGGPGKGKGVLVPESYLEAVRAGWGGGMTGA